MSLEMIIDRTMSDVNNAKLLRLKIQSGQSLTESEQSAFERGACTITMLNRIENVQKTLAELLNKYAYRVSVSTKTDWGYSDIFDNANYNRILNNLNVLKSAYYTYSSTPDTPGYIFGYEEANDIEKILSDIDGMITSMKNNFRECGTFNCGKDE